jgi:hypothetical protein
MSGQNRTKKLETELRRNLRRGLHVDERLAIAAEQIAEAEATFRRLAEPRFHE